jgi:opacity protein-like surface antigen
LLSRISLDGAAHYASTDGADYDFVRGGYGFDVQLRVAGGSLSLGVGYARTSHDLPDIKEDIHVGTFFAEPRVAFALPTTRVTPYVAARVGRATQKLEVGTDDAKWNGWSYGAGGGLLIRVAPTVDVDLGTLLTRLSFGDVKFNGTTQPDSKIQATTLALRAGLSIGFGTR